MTVANQLKAKIEVKTQAKMSTYFASQPNLQQATAPNPQPRAISVQLVAAAYQDSKEEGEATLIGKQYARDLAKMKLFYASIDGALVVIPTFTTNFLDCYRQASAEDNKQLLRQSFTDH